MKKSSIILLILLLLFVQPSLIASVQSLKTIAKDTNLPLAVRMEAIDSLLKLNPDDVDLLLLSGGVAMGMRDYSKTLEVYERLYLKHYNEIPINQKCEYLARYAQILSLTGRERDAVRLASDLKKLDKPDSLLRYDFDAYLVLFSVSSKTSNPTYRDKSYEKLVEIYNNLKRKNLIDEYWLKRFQGTINKAKMLCFQNDGNMDSVIAMGKNVMKYAIDSNDSSSVYITIADAYSRLGRSDIAENLYKKVLDSQRPNLNSGAALSNYIETLVDSARYDDALSVADKYGFLISDNGNKLDIIYFNYFKGAALAGLQRYDEAVPYLQKAFTMICDIYPRSQSYVNESVVNFELEEMLNLKESQAVIAQRRGKLLVVAGLAIFVLAACAIWFLFAMVKARRNAVSLENRYSEEFARFDGQHRELTALSLQLARVHKLLDDAREKLDGKGPEGLRIENALASLREADNHEDTWNSFKLYFEGCHPRFLKKLYSLHPSLTENDVRICVYILLNFTTKEIAAMTNRSFRTVETLKYRLHKKLGLSTGSSTLAYLRSLLS